MAERADYDLHLHSWWSYDATVPPERYAACAQRLGMKCLAVADHHVLDGLQEVLFSAAKAPGVRFVTAGEFTVSTRLGTFDLLCYGFAANPNSPGLCRVLDRYHAWQREYGGALSRAMAALGVDVDDQARLALLKTYRPAKALRVQGITHVKNQVLRRMLMDRGVIRTAEDYQGFLARAREAAAFPPYPDVEDVAPAIKEAGARIAIAHPFRYFEGVNLKRMDAIRDVCALDGVECAHPTIPHDVTPRYREYCVRHRLFSTGGSDCHAEGDVVSMLGAHAGRPEWLEEFLAAVDG